MSFINKKWQKGLGDTVVKSLLRVGGAMGAGVVIKKVFPDKGTNATSTQKTLFNLGGPITLVAAVAADVLAANENIKAFAQGMTVIAAAHSLNVIAPSISETVGLSGLSAIETHTAPANENKSNAALMGAAGNVGALPSGLPEQFNSVKENQIQNDGNPWNEIAEKIDDPNTTVKVEGTDADLMGAEDAELMGMF